MKSLKRHEGWLMIDHRAGAGLPEHIARLSGYDPKECGEGQVFESATITCIHCGNVYVKNKLRTRARGYCKHCDHYICDSCDALRSLPNYIHKTFRQIVEESIEAENLGRTYGASLPAPPRIVVS